MQHDLWTPWGAMKPRQMADLPEATKANADRTAILMIPARYGMSFGAMRFLDHSTSQQEHEPS